MSNEIIIDDNDRQFSYTGFWEILKTSNDQQWRGTAHSTWDFDATASLTFTGVQIKVYGTVPAGRGTSAVDFAVDGGNGERVWHTSGSTTLYGVLFYDSGPLSSGSHTIRMSNKGEDNDMDFRLDRVVILSTPIGIVAPPQPTTPGNPPSQASTPTPALTNDQSATVTFAATHSSTVDNSALSNPTHSLTSVLPAASGQLAGLPSDLSSGLSPSPPSPPSQISPSVLIGNSPQATETIVIAKETSGTSTIVGSVVGVVAFLGVIGALIFLRFRRRGYPSRISDSPAQSASNLLPNSSAATHVLPFRQATSATDNSSAPSGTNFTTKPIPTSCMEGQQSGTLSYARSTGSREELNPSEFSSPLSYTTEKNITPVTSSFTTRLNNTPGTGDLYEARPWHDLDRPPSYSAPSPNSAPNVLYPTL